MIVFCISVNVLNLTYNTKLTPMVMPCACGGAAMMMSHLRTTAKKQKPKTKPVHKLGKAGKKKKASKRK